VRPPELARGAAPVREGERVAFEISRAGFNARASLPARPRGWLVVAEDGHFDDPEDYATLRVARPASGEWTAALVAGFEWLRSLRESQGLEIGLAGAGAGAGPALAAAERLGPRLAALVLDRAVPGPLVLCPLLELAATGDAGLGDFLDRELSSPCSALNHEQRRRLARGLARGLRRERSLGARGRSALAALAGALAFLLATALGVAPAQAAVTVNYNTTNLDLVVESDGVGDLIEVTCVAGPDPQVEVNGVTIPGIASAPNFDPTVNCYEVAGLTVSGAGGADTIDVDDVENDGDLVLDDFTNLGANDISLEGGLGADSIVGTLNIAGELAGGGANDTLQGSAFAGDVLKGGADDDSVAGAGGSDTLDYSGAAGPVDVNLLTGTATGQGTDTVSAENAIGTPADDSIVAGTAISSLLGGGGEDSLTGSTGADTLLGEAGTDSLSGVAGADSIAGGTEDDTLLGGTAVDDLDGESGSDLASYETAAGAVSVNLATGVVSGAESDDIDEIEQVIGSTAADTLTGSTAADTLLGSAGADQIDGGFGNDLLNGEAGADSVNGLNGADSVFGGGDIDTLQGDQHPTLGGGASNDLIDGGTHTGAGDLLLAYTGPSASQDNVVISDTLANSFGFADTLASIERASLTGDADANLLGASDGVNLGTEFSGPITIDGAGGADTLRGGDTGDSLVGGTGTDQVAQLAGANQTLGPTALSGLGTDTLQSIDEASLQGDSGANDLDASAFGGPVSLNGSGGNDTLDGGSVGDELRGSGGADTVNAGLGDDTVFPGTAEDTVDGGGGTNAVSYVDIAGPVDIDLGADRGTHLSDDDTLASITHATGSDHLTIPDTLAGGPENNSLDGSAGPDRLEQVVAASQTLSDSQLTGAGSDTIAGLESASLSGGAGAHTIDASAFTGPVSLAGLAGDDTLLGGEASDSLDGGADTDLLAQTADTTQTLTDSQLTGMGTDAHAGFERASLVGGAGANLIDAGAFNSPVTLAGLGGADTMLGGSAGDLLQSDDGGTADSNDCGPGVDTADVDTADSSVACETVNGAADPPTNPTNPPTTPTTPTNPTNPTNPGAQDTRAPTLVLKGEKKQDSKKKLKLEVTSDEDATVALTGTIKVPKVAGGKKDGKKKLDLKAKTVEVEADQTETVKVKFSSKTKKLVKKALKAAFTSKAKVTAEATDAAGNAATEKHKIKVKTKG
jgi:Ca2+-binding RTX toxin-like protein